MTRDEFARRLVEYIDGKLDAGEAREFREFLRSDPEAAREVRHHQDVDRLLDLLPGAPASPGTLERMAEYALAEAGAVSSVSLKPLLRWVSLAAAAVLVGGLWMALHGGPEPTAAPLPEFLNDPEFVAHFEVIQNLSDLEEWGHLLDGGDEALFDLVALEFLEGA